MIEKRMQSFYKSISNLVQIELQNGTSVIPKWYLLMHLEKCVLLYIAACLEY